MGFVAAACLWLGLAWIPRRLAPVDALQAFARARGLPVRGDGVLLPLTIVGVERGRPFTVTWQRPAGAGDVLLIGVDCAVEDADVAPLPEATGAVTAAGDSALVTRWVRPGADVLEPARLAAIVAALARMAEEVEAAHPGAEPEVE